MQRSVPDRESQGSNTTKIDAAPENISEVFHELLGFKSRFKRIRSFFRTRRRIKEGESLFDCTADELKGMELMGPLTFNVYSTTIAATIVLGIAWLLDFYLPQANHSFLIPGNNVTAEFEKVLPRVEAFLRPFLVPTSFLFIAYWISWGSIRGREPKVISLSDESVSKLPPSRLRGRNAYLYFNGAFGFIPQTVISLTLSVFLLMAGHGLLNSSFVDPRVVFVAIAAGILFYVFVFYQAFLTFYKFPKLLFKANGYYDPEYSGVRPPWTKYILTAVFIVPVISFTITALYYASVIILSRFFAVVSVFVRGGEL